MVASLGDVGLRPIYEMCRKARMQGCPILPQTNSVIPGHQESDSGGVLGEWGDHAFEEVPLPPPQTPQVTFSSLQVVLHTQALLSALGYLMAVVPAREKQPPALQRREETQRTESAGKEGIFGCRFLLIQDGLEQVHILLIC